MLNRFAKEHRRRRSAAWTRLGLALLLAGIPLAAASPTGAGAETDVRPEAGVRLMTLDPGHFHAALIQKEMYPDVSDVVHVYAPLGPDLSAHLNRIALFNRRPDNPTRWKLEVHLSPDFFARMLRDHPGNVVVLSGRNYGKIDRIQASVKAGLHVLADKPWIITYFDFPGLQAALDAAEEKGIVAYDVMTERYEITSVLQKALVGDPAVAGTVESGTEEEPGVSMESVHHVMKTVAGQPNLRPAWFFNTGDQGEGIADVGTHLVDLAHWMVFPEQAIDHTKDITLVSAKRWPTVISQADYERVTGEKGLPAFPGALVKDGAFHHYANTQLSYAVRGIHTRVKVEWKYEAPAGTGDTHAAVVRGSKARIEVRQGPEQKYRPELYVVPVGKERPAVLAAVKGRVAALQSKFAGVAVQDAGAEIHVVIPDSYRTTHESHFGQVTAKFLEYVKNPKSLPRWEKANMLAKYYVTTQGVEMSRRPPK